MPTADRVCSGYHVQAGRLSLLLDCGPGILHRMAQIGVDWRTIDAIALTHFHTDHVGGLPMLLFSLRYAMPPGREKPLHIIGPPGTRDLLGRIAAAFGDYVLAPGFPMLFTEIASRETVDLVAAVVRAHATPHTPESVAYRVEAECGAIGYTGDTGPEHDLGPFMRGVALLISECTMPDDEAPENHLTPSGVARLASESKPGTLVLTHMFPQLDPEQASAAVREAGWEGKTLAAHDGLVLDVPPVAGATP
jgi:ribonuclease BN (tRNA processing enzyme)